MVIDPKAVDVAYENAALNGIGRDHCPVFGRKCYRGPGVSSGTGPRKSPGGVGQHCGGCYHPLAPVVPQLLDREGTFLCSGIIDTRGDEVAAALEQAGLLVTTRREKNGWIALEARVR